MANEAAAVAGVGRDCVMEIGFIKHSRSQLIMNDANVVNHQIIHAESLCENCFLKNAFSAEAKV